MNDYPSPAPEKQTGLIIMLSAGFVALAIVVAGVVRLAVLRSPLEPRAPEVAQREKTPPTPRPTPPPVAVEAPPGPPLFTEQSRPAAETEAADLPTQLRRKLANNAIEEVKAALLELASKDPRKAVELAESLGRDSTERHLLVGTVLRAWAAADPQRAWDWSLRQGRRLEVPGEPNLIAITLEGVAARSPESVTESIKALLLKADANPDFPPQEITYYAVDALIKNGRMDIARAAVYEWLQTSAAEQISNGPIERLAVQMADHSPKEAARWLESLPTTEGRNFAVATLAANWAGTDPKTAITWASGLDVNSGRLDAMQRAFNRWAERDMVDAAKWLETNEADPVSDRLIHSFVSDSTLSHSNPKVAVQWAELISDETMRSQSIEQVAAAWGASDPAAARRYVTESTLLSPEQKTRLLQNFSGAPSG